MTERELVRQRLWAQHLTAPVDAVQAVGDLCGLQAQYGANALQALRIRSYSDDTAGLVKSWTLRGTLHLFPQKDLPLYFPAQVRDLFDTDYARWRFSHDCSVTKERMAFFCGIIREALTDRPISRDALKDICRQKGMTEREEPWVFDGWGGAIRMLAECGQLCVSARQARHYVAAPPFARVEKAQARLALLERYITHYGPVTMEDMAYFFRWPKWELKALMAELPLQTEDCKGVLHYWLQQSDVLPALPRCLFLAGFDPMLLGYEKTENPILPAEYRKQIFNNTGIVFPALLVDGVVRGKWKEQPRRVEVTLFESLSDTRRRAVEKTSKALWPDKPVKFL